MTTRLRAHARMAVPTGYKSLHMLAAATSVNMQNVRQFFVQRQDVDEAEWEALQQRDRKRTEAIISRAKTDLDHSVKETTVHTSRSVGQRLSSTLLTCRLRWTRWSMKPQTLTTLLIECNTALRELP